MFNPLCPVTVLHTPLLFLFSQLLFVCQRWFLFDFSQCKSYFIPLIMSYTSITNIDFCFDPFTFHFLVHFLFSRRFDFGFPSWHFDVFSRQPVFNYAISFQIYIQILDSTDWERPTPFATLHCALPSSVNFIVIFFILTWLFFHWSHLSIDMPNGVCLPVYQLDMPNCFLTVDQFAGISCFRNANYKIIPYFSQHCFIP